MLVAVISALIRTRPSVIGRWDSWTVLRIWPRRTLCSFDSDSGRMSRAADRARGHDDHETRTQTSPVGPVRPRDHEPPGSDLGPDKPAYQCKGTVYPQDTVPTLVTSGLCRRWLLWLSRRRVQ
jgi:hypothetical protein